MYYLLSIILMLVIFFVWQIPADKQEKIEFNELNKTTLNNEKDNITPSHPPIVVETVPNQEETKIEIASDQLIDQNVPFTSQAPFGGWSDERQQDGCEEASALMAIYWAKGDKLNKFTAWEKITDISDFEQRNYGEYRDIALNDVVNHIFKAYFNYDKVSVIENISVDDIIHELKKNNLILAPMDGQKLNNPYFTAPGPERHMLVIRGYDPNTKEFITNDPGTKRGEAYRYKQDVLFQAIRVYPTGYHEPINNLKKSVIIFTK